MDSLSQNSALMPAAARACVCCVCAVGGLRFVHLALVLSGVPLIGEWRGGSRGMCAHAEQAWTDVHSAVQADVHATSLTDPPQQHLNL